jgi:hypothetical protein
MSPKLMIALAEQLENERRRDCQHRRLLLPLFGDRDRGTSANRSSIRLVRLISGFNSTAARSSPR